MLPAKTPFIGPSVLLSEAVANGNRLADRMLCYVAHREADGSTWYTRAELIVWARQYASVAIGGQVFKSVKNSSVHLPLQSFPEWPQGTTPESIRLTLEAKR